MVEDLFKVLEEYEEGVPELKEEKNSLRKLKIHIENALNPSKEPEDQKFSLPEDYRQLALLHRDTELRIQEKMSAHDERVKEASEVFNEIAEDLRSYNSGEKTEKQIKDKYEYSPEFCSELLSDYMEIFKRRRKQTNKPVAIEEETEPDIEVIADAVDEYLGFKKSFEYRKREYLEGRISDEKMAETAIELGMKRKIAADAFERLEDIEGVDFDDYEEENRREMDTEQYQNHIKAGILYKRFKDEEDIELDNHWTDKIIDTLVKKGEEKVPEDFQPASSL